MRRKVASLTPTQPALSDYDDKLEDLVQQCKHEARVANAQNANASALLMQGRLIVTTFKLTKVVSCDGALLGKWKQLVYSRFPTVSGLSISNVKAEEWHFQFDTPRSSPKRRLLIVYFVRVCFLVAALWLVLWSAGEYADWFACLLRRADHCVA